MDLVTLLADNHSGAFLQRLLLLFSFRLFTWQIRDVFKDKNHTGIYINHTNEKGIKYSTSFSTGTACIYGFSVQKVFLPPLPLSIVSLPHTHKNCLWIVMGSRLISQQYYSALLLGFLIYPAVVQSLLQSISLTISFSFIYLKDCFIIVIFAFVDLLGTIFWLPILTSK